MVFELFMFKLMGDSLEQNIGIIACSIPALQPLAKKWLDGRKTRDKSTKPGARNNPHLSIWKDSTTNAFSSRSRAFQHETSSDSEERILPGDFQGIRKTTDVELFYHDAEKDGPKPDLSHAV